MIKIPSITVYSSQLLFVHLGNLSGRRDANPVSASEDSSLFQWQNGSFLSTLLKAHFEMQAISRLSKISVLSCCKLRFPSVPKKVLITTCSLKRKKAEYEIFIYCTLHLAFKKMQRSV